MTMNKATSIPVNVCPMCNGTLAEGFTTFSADIQGRLFVARRVPARICEQCGEEWLENAITIELEQRAMAAFEARSEVEIISFAA
ncbi:MAG: type II toxin-antitoxin system MqsA family antitoxin [Candidatus Kapaibacterium sp.]|nr:MAG: type II toxin-antitoxin system MqsA family antitoxin [Candidatus Kapabacteria bacterium]